MSGATIGNLLSAARTKIFNALQKQGTSTRTSFTPMFDRLRVDDVNAALFADLYKRNANPIATTASTPINYDPAKDALKVYNDAVRNRVIGPW